MDDSSRSAPHSQPRAALLDVRDAVIRLDLGGVLEAAGFHVVDSPAEDAPLQLAVAHRPGIEAARPLMSRLSERQVPLVVVSEAEPDDLPPGIAEWLTMPFNEADFLKAVDRVLTARATGAGVAGLCRGPAAPEGRSGQRGDAG